MLRRVQQPLRLMSVFSRGTRKDPNAPPLPPDDDATKKQGSAGYAFSRPAFPQAYAGSNGGGGGPGSTRRAASGGPSSTFQSFAQSASIKQKAMFGRIKASNLFTFNKELPKQALQEKTYWELHKDAHPVNRRWYQRWEKKVRQESIFTHRIETMPVDQKYKLKKNLMSPSNVAMGIPVGMILYFLFCYVRYVVWGVSPSEASVGTARFVQMLPRPPAGGGAT